MTRFSRNATATTFSIRGTLDVYFTPLDARYLAGYRATTARDIEAGFASSFGHDEVLLFAHGANAFAVAHRYGVDLSAEIIERETR